MRDWLPYLGSALSTVAGGVIALLATWLTQRSAHRREHETKRRAALLKTYSEWASLLDHRHQLLTSAVRKGKETEEEQVAQAVDRNALWKEIYAIGTKLRAATYKVVFLEQDATRRAEVHAIHKVSNYWQDKAGWFEFVQDVEVEPDLAPPYARQLDKLIEGLAIEGALR